MPGNHPARLATGILCNALWWATLASSALPQQDLPAIPNATVKADSVDIYEEMRLASPVVSRLKKGDAVIVDYVFQSATENWCSVRLPAEKVRLGYAPCAGLDRQERRAFDPTGCQGSHADGRGKDPAATPKTAKRTLNNLPITAPSVHSANGYEQMAALILHDDAIDVVKLGELDSAARNGSAAAMGRAALGHYVAGNFELSRESSDEAVEQFNTAAGFATKQPNLLLLSLLSLAYVQLRHSEYSAALKYLQRAHSVAPNSLWVAQLSGWAYYGLDRKDEAISQWQLAQRIRPSPQVADLLEKAERDKETEGGFREGETRHFLLHYQGNATPQLAVDVLRTLEEHFRTLQSELRVTPAEPIAVVLYTQETFRDVTGAPGWADAANDGRIRVPVQGMSSVSSQLSRILMHELTHSFIRQKTQGRCPQWLGEGLAQWMEGIRSERTAPLLVAAYEQGRNPALKQLESSWAGFSGQHALYAYAWSLAAVETIIANSSMWGIERLLGSLSAGSSVESALGSALQTNYADLDRSVADYLRKTYGPPSP